MHEIQYLWDHWKINADQRIKAFNFFVVFSVFADGGVFSSPPSRSASVPAPITATSVFSISVIRSSAGTQDR